MKGLNLAEADMFTAEYINLNKNWSCIGGGEGGG